MKNNIILTAEDVKKIYFSPMFNELEHEKKHVLMLAKSEQARRDLGYYKTANEQQKKNSVKRIKHYIELRHREIKNTEEYKIFIDSMQKSLDILEKN